MKYNTEVRILFYFVFYFIFQFVVILLGEKKNYKNKSMMDLIGEEVFGLILTI